MPSTEIILTENVPGLGAEADVVKVRRGYARNYLPPRGKAHEVTPAALRQLDALKHKRAEREAGELNEAEELARRIGKARFVFTLETGDIVSTGTPPGVGCFRKPPVFLKSGDAMAVVIEGIGRLESAVRADPRPA